MREALDVEMSVNMQKARAIMQKAMEEVGQCGIVVTAILVNQEDDTAVIGGNATNAEALRMYVFGERIVLDDLARTLSEASD